MNNEINGEGSKLIMTLAKTDQIQVYSVRALVAITALVIKIK